MNAGRLGVGLPSKVPIQASSIPRPGHIPFRKGLGLAGGKQGSQHMCRPESIGGRERALGSAFHRWRPQAWLSPRSSASGLTFYSLSLPWKCAGGATCWLSWSPLLLGRLHAQAWLANQRPSDCARASI